LVLLNLGQLHLLLHGCLTENFKGLSLEKEILGLLSQAIYKYKAGIFLQFNP